MAMRRCFGSSAGPDDHPQRGLFNKRGTYLFPEGVSRWIIRMPHWRRRLNRVPFFANELRFKRPNARRLEGRRVHPQRNTLLEGFRVV